MAVEDGPGRWGRSSVILEDNELHQNHFNGIRMRGSVSVAIRMSRIYLNGEAGIHIDREAQVTVTDCDIFRNERAGINIEEAAGASIERNRIHENKMGGIRISRSGEEQGPVSTVKIANNRIYGNEQGGIRSMPQGDSKVELTVIENSIYGNKKGGIRVENNTKLSAKGNYIYNNGTVGIVSHESIVPPELDIYQNRVSFNHGPGVHVLNGITGEIGIRNNWVFNNHRSGILCGLWSDPNKQLLKVEIINNTIVSNGSSGQGSGIRNDSKGKAFIINNIIAYNYVTGIRVRTCKDYSYNLLFANGDVGNCCEDVHSAPSWIESLQLGGCREREKGDLLGDPLFEDPDNYNFYLRDESPAIDAGKDDPIYNDASSPKGTNRNDMGATGGPYAASGGYADTVEALLEAGADVDAKALGFTPLMSAVKLGRVETVKALLAAGADVNAEGADGRTALMIAKVEGHTEIAKLLKKAGATRAAMEMPDQKSAVTEEINKELWQATEEINKELWQAAEDGYTDRVKALIAKGADLYVKDKNGQTVLMCAASWGHTETVQALLDAGADVNAEADNGVTALMGASLAGHTETVKALLAGGADINAKALGSTPLMSAVKLGRVETVKAMVAAGADVNAVGADGRTALMIAKVEGHTEIAKLLKKAGATRAEVAQESRSDSGCNGDA
jgi:parallel beta-helix repeat protein